MLCKWIKQEMNQKYLKEALEFRTFWENIQLDIQHISKVILLVFYCNAKQALLLLSIQLFIETLPMHCF